jgi:hypothetical protein
MRTIVLSSSTGRAEKMASLVMMCVGDGPFFHLAATHLIANEKAKNHGQRMWRA